MSSTEVRNAEVVSPLLLVPLGPGEVLDRLTVLLLKAKAARTQQQRSTIYREQELLSAGWQRHTGSTPQASTEWDDLLATNAHLWNLEDEVRAAEARADFGPAFIAAARAIYRTNDRRAQIKRAINDRLGSSLCDFKFHDETPEGATPT